MTILPRTRGIALPTGEGWGCVKENETPDNGLPVNDVELGTESLHRTARLIPIHFPCYESYERLLQDWFLLCPESEQIILSSPAVSTRGRHRNLYTMMTRYVMAIYDH